MTHSGKIRVARVITRMNVGGPSRHARILHQRLDPDRFETSLLFGETDTSEGNLEFEAGTSGAERIPGLRRELGLSDLGAFATLRRRIGEFSPTIVHTHMAKAGTLGRMAARRARVPIVLHTFHGHVLEGYFASAKNRFFIAIERALAKRTDALVAVSEAVRDELLELGIGRREQWRVIPVGLDLDDLLRQDQSKEEARRRLGFPDDGPVVGIVGRLVPIKDHATFLQAAARVAAKRPDVTFVVAGDGELRGRVEDDARKLLGNRALLTGWIFDLPALYAALDIVVLTSRNEGTPVALIEAGAAGKPVVATAVGGVPEVVRDGVTGLLSSAGDVETLASSVLSLLEQPERAASMGEAARAWVRARFSSDRLVSDVTALYEELVAGVRK